MANTLTNLIPDVYAALDVVSRELIGFIPSVQRDASADRVAINQTLRVAQTPKNTGGRDITPAMAFPSASDQTITNRTLTITKQRAYPFSWTGEEQFAVDQGPGYLTLQQDQIAQALRAAANEMELDLALAAYKGASRAYGTAGTTPFASTLAATGNLKKILDDNGAPESDRHLVIDTTAGVNIRTLSTLIANPQLTDQSLLRQGSLLNVHGFEFRESAQISPTTAGTGTNYVVNAGGGLAVGTTTIPTDVGAGTILAGDVVTFAGDTNKYTVATALAAGSFTIQAPGLKAAHADEDAITVSAAYTPNVGFVRSALLLGARLPMIPKEGDLAIDRETVTDPRSGISFEVAAYPGYRMMVYEIAACWGVLAIKPEHIAILLG
jgi:hypothetical protein